MGEREKVVIIGLDGATFDIINPMVKEGSLPNIAGFMKEGGHGNLKSTIHPTTPHAWSSFMTGKNAGKHGIFDFSERVKGTYDIRLINGGFRNGDSLWKILSANNKKVLVVNVPFTYPAEEVNGVLISGLDAPGIDGDFAYPKDIYKKIVKDVGKYDLRGTFPIGKTKSWYKTERIEDVIQNRVDVSKYLMNTCDWDFFMIVFGSTDHVQHMFWRYMEEKQRGVRSKDVDLYGDIISHTYKLVDAAVGEITEEAGEDANVVLMSDHGGGSIKSIVYLNKWLENEGLLKFKDSKKSVHKSVMRNTIFHGIKRTRYFMKRFLPANVKTQLKLLLPGFKDKAESFLYFSNIDWTKTKAYAFGMYGNININLKGRDPMGIITNDEYDEVVELIISKLKLLKDPDDNSSAVDQVHKKEDLFHGNFQDKAPDLLVAWRDYVYFSKATLGAKEETVFGSLFNIDSSDFEYSGTHRLNGIFLCKGKDIKKNTSINGAKIYDIAPTILHLMGMPVPDDMDGKVLNEIFTDEHIKDNPVTTCKSKYTEEDLKSKGKYYSDNEEKEIIERLQGLGYIE